MKPGEAVKRLLSGESPRTVVVDLLGGRCVACGWDKDWRALFVKNNGVVKRNRGKQESVYWQELIGDILNGGTGYSLQCANCQAIARHPNLGGPQRKQVVQQPDRVYLFECDVSPEEMPETIAWAEELQPLPVYLWSADTPGIWSYSPREQVFSDWEGMCEELGVDIPVESNGFIEVRTHQYGEET